MSELKIGIILTIISCQKSQSRIKHPSGDGMQFAAMDSARVHGFAFNQAVFFIVHSETQEEIDYYWGKLSADPKAEQCGWLKDRYGVSWKIVPTVLDKMLRGQDKRIVAQVTEAFLERKKFDIEALEKACNG